MAGHPGGPEVLTKLPTKGSIPDKVIRELPKTFADLGPTYVQVPGRSSPQPRRVRRATLREFRSLLDAVPPADTAEVHKLFKQELGADPADLFKTFEEEPFASASIAQVHFRRPAHRRTSSSRSSARASAAGSPRTCRSSSASLRWWARRRTAALGAGRRRRLRRQPRRGTRLPHRGAVDGGLGPACMAPRPQYHSAASALGVHQ